MTSSNEITLAKYIIDELEKIAIDSGFLTGEYKFEQDVGSKHGDGFIGELKNVRISGKRQKTKNSQPIDDHLDLVCKIAPESEARREMFNIDGVFNREVYMYTKILPAFVEFQHSKGIQNEIDGFFQYPRVYYAISNGSENKYVIIMDDLRPIGYKLWNKFEPITFEHVKLVITALARYHGISFALREQRPEIFDLCRPLNDCMLELVKASEGIEDFFTSGHSRAAKLFQQTDIEYRILTEMSNTFKDSLDKMLGPTVAEPFSIIGHGDSWINNFMFLNENDEIIPSTVRILDWQESRFCSPAIDFTYFILLSTTKEFRTKYFNEICDIYYDSLAEIIRRCGNDPNLLFSRNEFERQMKLFGKFAILMCPTMLNIMVTDPKDITQMDEFAESMIDKETKDLVNHDDKTEQLFRTRLSDAIFDAIQYGWIDSTV